MENVMRKESFNYFVSKLSGIVSGFVFISEDEKTSYRYKELYYDSWSGQPMVRLVSFNNDQNEDLVPDRVVIPVYFLYRNDYFYKTFSDLWHIVEEKESVESVKKEG